MPNPRNKHSKQRTRTRRAHYKVATPTVAKCKTTGESHIYHHAYYDSEGNMRYRGKILVKSQEEIE
jgi:large subunit ribosomal protein L32